MLHYRIRILNPSKCLHKTMFKVTKVKCLSFLNKGTTLRLDTWDGWVQFLRGCLRGRRLTVQGHLLEKIPVKRSEITNMNMNKQWGRTVVVQLIHKESECNFTHQWESFLLIQISVAGSPLHCCRFGPPGPGLLAAGERDACWETSGGSSLPPVVPPNLPSRHRKVSHTHSCRERPASHSQALHQQKPFGLGLSGPRRSGPFESCCSARSQRLCALFSR